MKIDIMDIKNFGSKIINSYIGISLVLTIFNRINWNWLYYFVYPIALYLILEIICYIEEK